MIFFNLGSGRKIKDPCMVYHLLKWYYSFHICEGQKITAKDFRQKAKDLSTRNDFRASKGWFEKFKKKYKIELKE